MPQDSDDDDEDELMVGHMFMYQVWKTSLDIKLFSYLILILAIAIILWLFSFYLVRQQKRVTDQRSVVDTLLSATTTDTTALNAAYASLDELSDDYNQYLTVLFVFNILTFGYIIQDFQLMLYARLRDVFVNPFGLLIVLNTASSITIIVWLIKYFGDYAQDLDSYREELRVSVALQRMENDEAFNIKVVLALLIAFQFGRLVLAFQVSRTFGPMVKILGSMLYDVMVFIFLYAAIFFIFAGSGQLLFAELAEYEDIGEAMKTIFASSIGEFEYSTYDSLQEVDPYVGYVFITFFLIMISIMLLNFLIAILSATYAQLNDVKNGLYLRRVILMRKYYNYDKYYSSIVFTPPPFNIFSFIIMPFVVCKRSTRLNSIFNVIEYTGIGICAVLGFIAMSLILWPFTYLLILVNKIKRIPQRPTFGCVDILLRICDFAFFLVVGPLLILLWIFLDIINFSMTLFSSKISSIDKSSEEKVSVFLKF